MLRKPFGQLKHFYREGDREPGRALLIVAPMSGHYATLLRGTVERLLPSYDVYITDWRDAKLVPLSDGSFDLDDYIDYLIEFLELIGEQDRRAAAHARGVPAGGAGLRRDGADERRTRTAWRPKTLTMMGGPIDTRKAPTAVNTLATQRPFGWFEQNVIATVPMIYPGAGRKVYPGFLQLAGFMTMNLGSHLISHWEMFKHLVVGDEEGAERDPEILRRISLGLRHDRRILPADGRRRVPAAPAAQGRDEASRPPGRSGGDPRHRAARDRGRARRHFRASARPRPRSTSRPSCPRRRSNISWPRTSAITASSTAASGARRSRRSSRSSSPPTPEPAQAFFIFTPPSIVSATTPASAATAPTRSSPTWKPANSCVALAGRAPRRAARSRSGRRCARPRC